MALKHPEWWKQLAPRYAETRPRKMLDLDGGATRGLLTLGILKKIEALVQSKGHARLCDYFDYIGGTSTGAIIAAGLARGKSVDESEGRGRNGGSGATPLPAARLIPIDQPHRIRKPPRLHLPTPR